MQKSKLLMTEQPIVINKELAKIIGLNEAIILQQIEYWVNINEKAQKESSCNKGFYWTYNTVQEWQEQFPFWSYDTVKRTLSKLRKKELLITDRFNKEGYDRTLWYRINYEKLNELEESLNSNSAKCPNEISCDLIKEKKAEPLKNNNSAKCPNAIVQNAPIQKCKMPQPIPEITTKTNTKIISSSSGNDDIVKFFEENICELKKTTKLKFLKILDETDINLVKEIISYGAETNAKSYAWFQKTLDILKEKNISTSEQFLLDISKYRSKKQTKNTNNVNYKNNKNKFSNFNSTYTNYNNISKIEQQILKAQNENIDENIDVLKEFI